MFCLEEATDSFSIRNLEDYLNENTWWVEPKIDGVRCAITFEKNSIKIRSRNGKELNLYNIFKNDLNQLKSTMEGYSLDGELFKDNFSYTNGMIHRTHPNEPIFFYVFDIIPNTTISRCKKYEVAYEERKNSLKDIFNKTKLINFKLVSGKETKFKDVDHFRDTIDEYIRNNYEGIVIKKSKSPYNPVRTIDWLKGKQFLTLDLQIVGIVEDNDRKWAKAILVEYNDKYLSVGSGLSNKLRYDLYKNEDNYVGRIVEIKFMEKTNTGVFRQPVFVRFRDDKTVPDR